MLRTCLAEGGSQETCEARAIRGANSAVGDPELSTERRLTIETALTVPPSRLTLNNREYLTAPAVLIVEGVLNDGYIAGEELVAEDWNAVPIVVNHPRDATQQPVSARQPDVLATCGIGHLYRCRLGEGQRSGHAVMSLCAELWIDVAQAQACGGEALQVMSMLEAQAPVEVSTGFYSDAVRQVGSFYGTPYREMLINLRPDHLAVLPNAIGACDWGAGCGAPRLHHEEQGCTCTGETCTCALATEEEEAVPPRQGWRGFLRMLRTFVAQEEATPPRPSDPDDDLPPEEDEHGDETEEDDETEEAALVVEQTDTDLRESLYGCLAREMGTNVTPIYIDSVDTETNSFVYRQGERLCRRYYAVTDGIVTLSEDHEDVQRTTTYTAVPGTDALEQEDYPMTMQGKVPTAAVKARVNSLINNERTTWTERERHYLEGQEEGFLILLEQQPLLPVHTETPAPTTLEQALSYIPDQFHVRETLVSAVRRYERHKNKLVEILVNTKTNPFSREELDTMDDTRLEQLVIMAGEPLPDQTPPHVADAPPNYTGRRMPQIRIVQDEAEAVPPTPDTLRLVVERRKELGLMG